MIEWREITEFSRKYYVSNHGDVKVIYTNGKEKIMKPWITNAGYKMIGFYKNGKKKSFTIHRLVAETFLDNPDSKDTVDHINRDKLDNRVENLRWATYGEQNLNCNYKCCEFKLIDNDNNIYHFNSQGEARDVLKLPIGYISRLVNGDRKQTMGYRLYLEGE